MVNFIESKEKKIKEINAAVLLSVDGIDRLQESGASADTETRVAFFNLSNTCYDEVIQQSTVSQIIKIYYRDLTSRTYCQHIERYSEGKVVPVAGLYITVLTTVLTASSSP